MIKDGAEAGNCKLFIGYNRNGTQMDEDQYLNFCFNGDTATIEQAEKFKTEGESMPY